MDFRSDILRRYRVGVWSIELEDGREPRMFVDETMAELLGIAGKALTPEETYHAWYDHIEPHHYDAVAEGVNQMVNGLEAEVQYPWIHPTRGVMYVRCGAVRDMTCKAFVRLEGTHQDVTNLNHVQKERREDVILREKLDMERRRYVMMSNLIKSAQWSFTYDAGGRLTSVLWSDEFRHMLGYKNGTDFPNELASWRELLHPDEASGVEADIEAAVGDRTGKIPYDVTYRLKTRNRGWRWFRARGEISRLADGQPFEFAGVMTDVDAEHRNTQLREERLAALEEVRCASVRLEKALTEARRAEQMESTFLATMSHEIRTPLNAVIGFAEFLRESGNTEQEREAYVQGILNSSNALLSLINDVLDLSKIQAGMMSFRGGVCDLERLFAEMDMIFRFSADQKQIALRCDLQENMPVVDLREERLRQILINLIGNAVKFTSTGEVVYSAVLKPEGPQARTLEIEVRDTGIGIPADRFETIFDPFSQDGAVRGGRVYQGTGLGLSICRRLLETVGGTIEVTSEVGRGSSFVVRIPNVSVVAQSRDAACPVAGGCRLDDTFSVVAVDDVPMNLRVVERHLEKLGVSPDRIRSFSTAYDALQDMRRERPSLLLTDMWMPEMNGEELAKAVRADPALRDLPIVAETADADSSNTFDLSAFDDVLTKPLTGEKIKGMLSKVFPGSVR